MKLLYSGLLCMPPPVDKTIRFYVLICPPKGANMGGMRPPELFPMPRGVSMVLPPIYYYGCCEANSC